MLLQNHKADIKQISPGDKNITIFWVIFAGIAVKTSIHAHSCFS